MPRAIWTGSLGFGLVNVPVKLYSATEDKDVHFHQLTADTGERIRYKRVAEESGKEVAYADIVKGYEVESGRFVTVTSEELEGVEPGRSRTIEIEDFVDLDEVDPMYFEKSYYLAPEDGAQKPYALLRQAMERAGKVAIGRFVMRNKEYYGALRLYRGIPLLLTDPDARATAQRACRYLLVDEFQDLTPAHVLLIRLLALPGLDVFGVGDDDQVIYGHVSADPAFLIDYDQLFPGAGDHPLTVNYRCPVEVVTGARTLLGYNDRRVAKVIDAGPDADATTGALKVVEHGPDDSAGASVEVVQSWLAEPGVEPTSIAVLARVNSLLLAPHVALASAGLPLASVLSPDVLERTGMRAALAYLRLATSADAMDPRDIVEILRRPTRGLPQWFPDRLARRATWRVADIADIADQVPDKESAKVLRLAGDLGAVVQAARRGTTRKVLEVVRDDVGLGSAMTLLDRTGGGQGSSHLDDLEGLLAVADLHPDPAGFEPWLRGVFNRETDTGGVTLSTIHRVKGREWPHVVVFGVDGTSRDLGPGDMPAWNLR